MTTQTEDSIVYEGRTYCCSELPLNDLPAGLPDDLIVPNTACRRGYVAHWEVDDSKLWLTRIDAERLDQAARRTAKVGVSDIFPGANGRVLADWYSGTISLPHGRPLAPHLQLMFAATMYEGQRLLYVELGNVKNIELRLPRSSNA